MFYHLKTVQIQKYTQYCLAKVEIKDYNVIIDRQIFFDQPVKMDLRTCNKNRRITTGQRDD